MLGLFFFAKMAPKFIKDALGLKGAGMSNVGLSGFLGAGAALVGGGGLKGAGAAMLTNMNGSAMAAGQGKAAPPAWQTGADLAAQIKTGDPKAKGGVVNNLTDRLMRGAGINAARRYGVTAASISAAKNRMYAAQDEAALAHNMAERGWDKMTDSERYLAEDAYRRKHKIASGSSLSSQQYEDMKAQGATIYASEKDSAYGKAKSDYEKANKFGESHRVSTSFEEEHRPSIKESLQSPYRAARNVATNIRNDGVVAGVRESVQSRMAENRGEHQSFTDRVVGDNKWSAGTDNEGGGNRVVDNPWMPGGPGGPPPGP